MSFQLISPGFSSCSDFSCMCDRTFCTDRAAFCWGSGVFTRQVGERGSGPQRAPLSSAASNTRLFGECAVEPEVRASAGTPSSFCCSLENCASDCMASPKVWWCWTSWRTHLDRPECKHASGGTTYSG